MPHVDWSISLEQIVGFIGLVFAGFAAWLRVGQRIGALREWTKTHDAKHAATDVLSMKRYEDAIGRAEAVNSGLVSTGNALTRVAALMESLDKRIGRLESVTDAEALAERRKRDD